MGVCLYIYVSLVNIYIYINKCMHFFFKSYFCLNMQSHSREVTVRPRRRGEAASI